MFNTFKTVPSPIHFTPLFVLLIALLSFNTQVYAEDHALDGKVFIALTGAKNNAPDQEDEIQFKDGRFYSVDCAKWGFGSGAYTTQTDGNSITFKATTMSPEHGKIVWEGKVTGSDITGTYVWTKERWWWFDAYEEYAFRGTMK